MGHLQALTTGVCVCVGCPALGASCLNPLPKSPAPQRTQSQSHRASLAFIRCGSELIVRLALDTLDSRPWMLESNSHVTLAVLARVRRQECTSELSGKHWRRIAGGVGRRLPELSSAGLEMSSRCRNWKSGPTCSQAVCADQWV